VVWTADRLGRFTIKSALQLMRQPEGDTRRAWEWVWKLKIPQRIKLFVWLLLHGRLLTNSERYRRRLCMSPVCELCQDATEDLDHLFRTCSAAQSVWQELRVRALHPLASEGNFHSWLHCNLQTPHDDPAWAMKFMVTLWYIWKWRCARCLGDPLDLPRYIGQFLLSKFRQVELALKQDIFGSVGDPRGSLERWIRWESGPEGWVTLNTDGAAKIQARPERVGYLEMAQGHGLLVFQSSWDIVPRSRQN